jgi:hypothetical protein
MALLLLSGAECVAENNVYRMTRLNATLIVIIIVLAAFVVYTHFFDEAYQVLPDSQPAPVGSTASATPLSAVPTSTSSAWSISDDRLMIMSPAMREVVGKTFTISGKMQNWFEANANYEVRDRLGKVVAEGFFTASDDNYGKFAPFTTQVVLKNAPPGEEGILTFIEYSAKDGGVVYYKSMPIQFAPDIQP